MTDDELIGIGLASKDADGNYDFLVCARAIEELAAKRGAAAERKTLDRVLGILADGDGIPKGLDTYEARVEHAIHAIRARSET